MKDINKEISNIFEDCNASLQRIEASMALRKEWVGLTDEEIDAEALKDDHAAYFALGAIWANKKLREKNT